MRMATLFALADRGVVTITEEPRKWGQRNFTAAAAADEPAAGARRRAVLNARVHDTKGSEEDAVPLTQARNRVGRHLRDFKAAVNQELRVARHAGRRTDARASALPGILDRLLMLPRRARS